MPARLAEIVDEFAAAPRDLVLEMLLEYADVVPPLPDDTVREGKEQVPECQTAFFLRAQVTPDGSVSVRSAGVQRSPLQLPFSTSGPAPLNRIVSASV